MQKTRNTSFCYHNKVVVNGQRRNCQECGVHIPENGVKTFKIQGMKYKTFFNINEVYNTMFKRQIQRKKKYKSPEFSSSRKRMIDYIYKYGQLFKISENTVQLGVLLMDLIMMKKNVSPVQYKLYAAVSFFVAAKSIELDERIPFIPRLKRKCEIKDSIQDIKYAELKVLEACDWNPLYSTVLEVLEFYLCQGIIFSNDVIQQVDKQIQVLKEQDSNIENTDKVKGDDLLQDMKDNINIGTDEKVTVNAVRHLETKFKTKAQKLQEREVYNELKFISTQIKKTSQQLSILLIKDEELMKLDLKHLCAAAVAFLRKAHNISPVWNEELRIISGGLTMKNFEFIYQVIQRKYTLDQFCLKAVEIPQQMKNAPTLTRNSTFNCSDYISHLEKKYLLNDENKHQIKRQYTENLGFDKYNGYKSILSQNITQKLGISKQTDYVKENLDKKAQQNQVKNAYQHPFTYQSQAQNENTYYKMI